MMRVSSNQISDIRLKKVYGLLTDECDLTDAAIGNFIVLVTNVGIKHFDLHIKLL